MDKAGESVGLTAAELTRTFADPLWASKYPPILNIDQAAELLQISKLTIYDWRSRGLLKSCGRKVGKHLRFFRDRLLMQIFNEGLNSDEQ